MWAQIDIPAKEESYDEKYERFINSVEKELEKLDFVLGVKRMPLDEEDIYHVKGNGLGVELARDNMKSTVYIGRDISEGLCNAALYCKGSDELGSDVLDVVRTDALSNAFG